MQSGSQNLGAKTVMIQARMGEGGDQRTTHPETARVQKVSKHKSKFKHLDATASLFFLHTPGTAENLYLHKYIVLFYITTLD